MPRPKRPPVQHRENWVDPDELYDGPSKSQRKRDMTALQVLGKELVELKREQLSRVPLPEELAEAVAEAQKITSHEGKRRQLQYIGRLMREVDAEPIRAAMNVFKGATRAENAALHALERWRERLLADDAALTELAAEHSGALNPVTMQQLRASIRLARKEQQEGKAPRHARELFKIVRGIISPDEEDEDAI